ncbi:MAG: hypothetical protein HKN00_02390 [Flavobacteriaceae bacterium]|nr:hypothetical protein [Bacteroidia bacterium]NNF74005.1 hypothetical protein [Flavobacteriaceae bacterium]
MGTIANSFFEDAKHKLRQASDELYRPEEDVVSYMVCQNAHIAIENYLKGYLTQNQVDLSDFESVDQMYGKCKEINRNFEQINLSGHACELNIDDSRYCNSNVSRCYELANNLDTFLRQQKIIA